MQVSADSVISDNAPSSAAIFVGMRVCARPSSERVEYRLGVIQDRILQPPMTRFLVEIDLVDGTDICSEIWLTRASIRLLQVSVLTFAYLFSFPTSICSAGVAWWTVGRVSHSQVRGRGFESPPLHC